MGYITVILLLSSTFVYVSAGVTFGHMVGGTSELGQSTARLYKSSTLKFNTDEKYWLVIDAVVIRYKPEAATVGKLLGGPGNRYLEIDVHPEERFKENGLEVTAIILGRWRAPPLASVLGKSDITFS